MAVHGLIVQRLLTIGVPQASPGAPPPHVAKLIHYIYGDMFGAIAIAAVVAAAICYALSPPLTRWMHTTAAPPAQH